MEPLYPGFYTKYTIFYYFNNWRQRIEGFDTLIQADNKLRDLVKLGGLPERLRIVLCHYDQRNEQIFEQTLDHELYTLEK